MLAHRGQITSVVQDFSGVRAHQSDNIFNKYRLAGTASPDNQVCFSRFEDSTDVIEDNPSFKGLGDMFYFYHFLCQH